MLDDCLLKLLKYFMIDDAEAEVDKLLSGGPNAPLGTFSSRVLSAYCLGLISEDEFKDIEIIRKIRNDFAHNLLEISFDNQSIMDRCKNLSTPNLLSNIFELDAPGQFFVAVAMLSSHIALRALGVYRQRRTKPEPFTLVEHVKVDENNPSTEKPEL